jgi:hypothetical protein
MKKGYKYVCSKNKKGKLAPIKHSVVFPEFNENLSGYEIKNAFLFVKDFKNPDGKNITKEEIKEIMQTAVNTYYNEAYEQFMMPSLKEFQKKGISNKKYKEFQNITQNQFDVFLEKIDKIKGKLCLASEQEIE